jgi:hypothetical protein
MAELEGPIIVGILGQWASGKSTAASTLVRYLGGADKVVFISDRDFLASQRAFYRWRERYCALPPARRTQHELPRIDTDSGCRGRGDCAANWKPGEAREWEVEDGRVRPT